jgi:ArsR family transcriptional regulator
VSSLPLKNASVDATMCVLSLSYVQDVAASVTEIRRVLRPGGRAVIVDILPHDRDDFRRQVGQVRMGFDQTTTTDLLRSVGFASVTFRPLPPEPGAKGPALFIAIAS